MNFFVMDLEMNQPSEKIIQLGAVVGDVKTGIIYDEISVYVNPQESLSEKIVNLTGITDAKVQSGTTLLDAYEQAKVLHQKHSCFMNPVVWGGNDAGFLRSQLGMDNETWIFGRRFIDVKTLFVGYAISNDMKLFGGLARSMGKVGLKFQGKKHNALDDSKNTFYMAHFLISKMGAFK